MTLVEVMVALALGLMVMAGAGAMLLSQLEAHRRLLLEARMQQDLQLAMDLLLRSTRQRGYVDPSGPNITDWRLSAGTVQMKWDTGNWQSVTDAETVVVDKLDLAQSTTVTDLSTVCPLPHACSSSGSCPKATSTLIELSLAAHARSDVRRKVELRDALTLRSPALTGSCA
jgi:Tfp pilus assembly protein PilW